MKKSITALMAASAALTMTGCSSGATPLQEAWEACEEEDRTSGVNYDEEYDVLTVSGAGIENDGVPTADGLGAWLAWECIEENLDIPSHVSSHMGSTTALQGRQEASWDEFSAAWSYHPNSGFNVTIEGSQE